MSQALSSRFRVYSGALALVGALLVASACGGASPTTRAQTPSGPTPNVTGAHAAAARPAPPRDVATPEVAAPLARRAIPAGWRITADDVVVARGRAGMVASTDRIASEIGVEMLRRGGNAFDAVVAVHFALAVVNPEAGNLGGGGFLVARTKAGATSTLDFRETAPAAATRDMFLDAERRPLADAAIGHRAAGVPGSVRGMWELHRRHGALPWAELVAPAIALAERLVVHDRLAFSFARVGDAFFARFPQTARIFLANGRVLRVGDVLVQRDLAQTLARIRDQGADGFYRGRTAQLVAREMARGQGLITAADLAGYEAVWRDPVRVRVRGHDVDSMGPPSSGGVALASLLAMLEPHRVERFGFHSREHVHLFAEASRRAFADRNALLGDPAFVDVPTATLLSPDYLASRGATIDAARATPSREVSPGLPVPAVSATPREGTHTTHYSVVDGDGNAVAVTTTINSLYGARVVVEGAGFFLNNEMDDFAANPGAPNQYGLVMGEANAIAPRKRMLSSMSPTIVSDGATGRVRMVLGSPGGPTIISSVAQVIENVLTFGMTPREALAAPRLHHQHLPDSLQFERGGLDADVVAALAAMGHTVAERPESQPLQGDVQAIFVQPDGTLVGASDPRRGGAPVALAERVGAVH
jgi:gamma-glutamyltranspeptidase/glutathione hydrolase